LKSFSPNLPIEMPSTILKCAPICQSGIHAFDLIVCTVEQNEIVML